MRFNRNTRVGLLLIGVAIIVLAAVKLGQRNAVTPPAETATPVPTETVALKTSDMIAVARIDIPARTVLTQDMLELKKGASGESGGNDNYVTDIPTQAEGFVTSHAITHGAKIDRNADLLGHVNDLGVTALINPGFRAMSIAIPKLVTMHNLVKVGDYVDVVAAFDSQESRTIVQNRRVLAVDVFTDDYPKPFSIDRRGDYKAGVRGAAVPPPPPSNGGAPGGGPTPTPVPVNNQGQPPARPEASVTLEVTPDDVVSLNLASAASAPLDIALRPREAQVGVPEVRVASITKAKIAPYAAARGGATPAKPAASNGSKNSGEIHGTYNPPPMPPANGGISPMPTGGMEPVKPPTYDIPIYGDGKVTRVDTVRRPGAGNE